MVNVLCGRIISRITSQLTVIVDVPPPTGFKRVPELVTNMTPVLELYLPPNLVVVVPVITDLAQG